MLRYFSSLTPLSALTLRYSNPGKCSKRRGDRTNCAVSTDWCSDEIFFICSGMLGYEKTIEPGEMEEVEEG